jgi:capsule polysaccharide export protein KpsE/RkpR
VFLDHVTHNQIVFLLLILIIINFFLFFKLFGLTSSTSSISVKSPVSSDSAFCTGVVCTSGSFSSMVIIVYDYNIIFCVYPFIIYFNIHRQQEDKRIVN